VILGHHVIRQLWIQLRLLGLVALPVAAGLAAVIVKGQIDAEAGRLTLAAGFAISAVAGAVLVGTGFVEEIRSGAAAWLVVRAVPRTSLIGAWLVVPSLAVVVAYLLAGILAGLAIPPAGTAPPDPITIAIGVVAAAAPVIPASALALAIGVRAGARVTALATAGAAILVALPIGLLGNAAVHPGSGYWLVAGVGQTDRPVAVGLQSIGLCLALAAVTWLWAAYRFARRDL
jgi:hypothetical protein